MSGTHRPTERRQRVVTIPDYRTKFVLPSREDFGRYEFEKALRFIVNYLRFNAHKYRPVIWGASKESRAEIRHNRYEDLKRLNMDGQTAENLCKGVTTPFKDDNTTLSEIFRYYEYRVLLELITQRKRKDLIQAMRDDREHPVWAVFAYVRQQCHWGEPVVFVNQPPLHA